MPQFMLLLHEAPSSYAHLSAAEMQDLINRYKAWAGQMAAEGRLAGGEKLVDDGGRQLRLQGGRPLATDGPYAEAQDVVGGYFTIEAADMAEAERLAATCPHLHGSNWIEIRQTDPTGD